jgi:GntR family transcriptional regulator, uxu operon transcriptional repressor
MVETTVTSGATSGDRAGRLAAQILAAAEQAGVPAGGRLANERRLAAELGVTRSAVRHGLAVLEAQGKISREVGRGTFLVDTGEHPDGFGLSPLIDVGPADVMAVRRLVEPQAMALVVAWATPRDFEEMERCLAGGATAESYEDFEVWDLALHRCVFAAGHSQLLMRLYDVIEASRQGRMWGDLKRRADSRHNRELYQEDHRELVAALRARDTERAAAAMRTHLGRVEANLLGSASPGSLGLSS